jgi:uncharacterized membrane protein YfcA
MPVLLFFFDVKTATPLVASTGTILALVVTIKLWRHVKIKSMGQLLVSGLAGIPVGLIILKGGQNDILVAILGAVIIISSLFQLIFTKIFALGSDKFISVFGFIAGVFGVSYNIPAPPIVIYASLRGWDKKAFIGTLQGLFIILGIMVNIGHIAVGLWTLPLLKLLGICSPGVIIGIFSGSLVGRCIKQAEFDRYIHFILLVLGGLIMLKSLV